MKKKQKDTWKQRIKVFVELAIFSVGTIILYQYFTNLVSPKYLFNTEYSSPETEMWEGFDELPKNSLDCLYIGSSHFYNGINPLIIYERTGLTGYTMTCSGADMSTGYFLLNYALRTQKPQVVYLDVYTFFYDSFYNEAIFTKMVDGMKVSKQKMEAIRDWQTIDSEINLTYRLFPILDYHSRWEELGEYDFMYQKLKDSWMGFAPSMVYETVTHDSYVSGFGYDFDLPISDTMMTYFEKIVNLCNENGIKLVLLEMPCDMWTAHCNDTIGILAEQYGVEYWDYNTPEEFNALGLELDKSFRDPNHLNMYGGVVFSAKLAEKISTIGISSVQTSKVFDLWNQKDLEWNQYYVEKIGLMEPTHKDE